MEDHRIDILYTCIQKTLRFFNYFPLGTHDAVFKFKFWFKINYYQER